MKRFIMLMIATIVLSGASVQAEVGSAHMATVIDVREVFRIVTIQEPITTSEQVCENNPGIGGAIVGGVVGGLVGSRFGGGQGRGAMTALGAVAGAATGQRMTADTKCYMRDRISYIEREEEVIDGYIVTIEGGDEFRTKTRYQIGDRVRIRSTIE
jgi:uncharacterized protein YcfJ